jgi:hypothetical protein
MNRSDHHTHNNPALSDRELGLREIQKLASFAHHELQLKEAMTRFVQRYPDAAKHAEDARARGEEIKADLQALYVLGREQGADSEAARDALAAFIAKFSFLKEKAIKNLNAGDAAGQRHREGKARQLSGQAPAVRPRQRPAHATDAPRQAPGRSAPAPTPLADFHAQDIRGLAPASRWTLLIDETGDRFDAAAQGLGSRERQLGRWVGLLAPEQDPGLPPLPAGSRGRRLAV